MIFDGHNDALSRLWCAGGDMVGAFADGPTHVTVANAAAGGMGGGFFALYAPRRRAAFDFTHFDPKDFAGPLPAMLPQADALASITAQAGLARQWADAGMIDICTDAESLGRAFVSDRIACLLHLEGADAIDADLLALDALYALGLRSLGLVWSRNTIFGEGVPFALGRDGDTGGGLTQAGRALVAKCRAMGILVDTSHLTMKGFWDVAEAGVPLVATHSNACAHCLTTRNLTDDQLRAVGETDGMVGLNFGTVFLNADAWETGRASLDDCLRHLDHMIEIAGEDHVGIGSDFDGAPLPDGIDSAADLGALVAAMHDHGYDDALIAKISHENWLNHLGRHLKGRPLKGST